MVLNGKNSLPITALFFIQGIYYLITGIWPILHMESFIMITGPKAEFWLVKTVGMLIFVSGAAFLIAAIQRKASKAMIFLAVGLNIGFLVIDTTYVVQGLIDPVYLLDAALQSILLFAWTLVLVRRSNRKEVGSSNESN